MKHILSIFTLILCAHGAFSQNLEKTIQIVANEIGQKVIKKNKTRIAVADFVNNVGKSDALTKYITEQIEMGLINIEGDIQVMDRKHIKQLLSENHLQSEGLIDETTAKSAVSFIKVDGWAFGEITTFGDQIKISIKVIDINTALIYAGVTSGLITDPILQKFTQSTEEQVQPVNKDCIEKNTGDYSFTLASNYARKNLSSMEVTLIGHQPNSRTYNLIVAPDETGFYYNLPVGIYDYYFYYSKQSREMTANYYHVRYNYTGQIKVEKCKSKNFKIQY